MLLRSKPHLQQERRLHRAWKLLPNIIHILLWFLALTAVTTGFIYLHDEKAELPDRYQVVGPTKELRPLRGGKLVDVPDQMKKMFLAPIPGSDSVWGAFQIRKIGRFRKEKGGDKA